MVPLLLLDVITLVLVTTVTAEANWPDPEKDPLIFIANPVEALMPGHWVPLSVVKAILASTTTKMPKTKPITHLKIVTKQAPLTTAETKPPTKAPAKVIPVSPTTPIPEPPATSAPTHAPDPPPATTPTPTPAPTVEPAPPTTLAPQVPADPIPVTTTLPPTTPPATSLPPTSPPPTTVPAPTTTEEPEDPLPKRKPKDGHESRPD